MSEWITVSEGLPEDSGDYLVCGHGKMWICEMLNICGAKGWCNDAKNPIVEAWMPLPKSYKAESGKQKAIDTVKAVIPVEVPKYQIGQEVSIYFKDTMYIKGICQETDE